MLERIDRRHRFGPDPPNATTISGVELSSLPPHLHQGNQSLTLRAKNLRGQP